MRNLRRFFFRQRPEAGTTATPLRPPCPKPPVCVVGDLHGRLDLLERMLDAITARSHAGPDSGAPRLVFVGDMIDRGPDSAAVLHRLAGLTRTRPGQVICLQGNHERMLLDFLADPLRHGPRWLAHGGTETLASFGLRPWTRPGGAEAETWLTMQASALAAALPGGSADWLASLPLIWSEDRLSVTHAGADPDRAMAEQSAQSLLWGHPDFLHKPRRDGIWVAHGHNIIERAQVQDGRIAVDTGAWRSNRLSAAWIGTEGIEFVEVSAQ